MSNAPTLNVNDPAAVLAEVARHCEVNSHKVAGTIKRVQELRACADPTVRAAEIENLLIGMLIGVLDNQTIVLAALAHLMTESAERRAARVELIRPGLQGINGGRGQ
jgi:hypothetical protein